MVHVVNHAAFKALLFLGAGSIMRATGLRDLDRLGGLMRRMPITGATFTVGVLAIAALPPLNGFVSEWLLLQTLVHGVQSQATIAALMMLLAVGAIALTAGLAAATFVKALGTGFLALPRSAEAARAVESPRVMGASMMTLAGACVVLGVVPGAMVSPLERVVSAAGVRAGRAPFAVHGWKLTLPGGVASMSTAILAGTLGIAVLLVLAARRLASRGPRRHAENWGCGRVRQTARMEYTASSFAEPLTRVFDDVLRPDLDVDVTHREESRYYVESVRLHGGVHDAFEQHLYRPVIGAVLGFGRWARRTPERQCAPVPRVRVRRARRPVGGGPMTLGEVLASVLQLAIVVVGGPLLVGSDPHGASASRRPRRDRQCVSRWRDLRKLFAKERIAPEHTELGLRGRTARAGRDARGGRGDRPVRQRPRSPFDRVGDLFVVVGAAARGHGVPRAGGSRSGHRVRRHGRQPRDDDRRARRAHAAAGDSSRSRSRPARRISG